MADLPCIHSLSSFTKRDTCSRLLTDTHTHTNIQDALFSLSSLSLSSVQSVRLVDHPTNSVTGQRVSE